VKVHEEKCRGAGRSFPFSIPLAQYKSERCKLGPRCHVKPNNYFILAYSNKFCV